MDELKLEALFTDKQVDQLHEALQERFPIQVQINALYDAIQGDTTLLREVIGYRNYLAAEKFKGESILKVTGNLNITHANGQECAGEECTWPTCGNAKR